jgi:hypothetical protein
MNDPADVTSATIPLANLAPNRVPQICVKTGEPAQCLVPAVATATPKWAWLLVLLGGWPLFVARRYLFTREVLALPARNYVYDRLDWSKRGMFGCFIVAGVVTVASLATLNWSGLALAWLLAVCTTAGWLLIVPRSWVGAELIVGPPKAVRFTGIHRTAANAYGRA